jgi:hypothetical protein
MTSLLTRHTLPVIVSLLLLGCGQSPQPPAAAPESAKPAATVASQPLSQVGMPALNLSGLAAGDPAAGIDYILDGSLSMCGFFAADENDTSVGLPLSKLMQNIKGLRRSQDRILVFVQPKTGQKTTYVPFESYENQLLQGDCRLEGQRTELGLILNEYRSNPELQGRSVVMISDMHLLPSEQTGLDREYDQWLATFLADTSHQNIAAGMFSIRAPFTGTYYTVNNQPFKVSAAKKHIHLLWLTTSQAAASAISDLQQDINQLSIGQYPEAFFAQAEFLPQVRLLNDQGLQYSNISASYLPPHPNQLIDLQGEQLKLARYPNREPLDDSLQKCFDLKWNAAGTGLDFYPYPNAKTNGQKTCRDGDKLFRSQVGSNIYLQLPLQKGYQVTVQAPVDSDPSGALLVPLTDRQGHCIGTVSNATKASAAPTAVIRLQVSGSSNRIDTSYYQSHTLTRDGCTSAQDCSNLDDKTYQLATLVSSLATKSRQAVQASYPKTIDITVNCGG